ncbi:MAG: hypothetical protein A2542_00470 [Parcubacteria group bacterium RIFOXYD2_FULL_52_8]|nr:MAG: hypothetical protein A2542_00470 [Parcubacteria group bacterium RIFOXYD2_FULL_52_8]
MFIDGKQIVEVLKRELRADVAALGQALNLVIIQVGDDPVSTRYVRMKQRFGESIGVAVSLEHYSRSSAAGELVQAIARDRTSDFDFSGVIVQLPILATVDTEQVLNTIPLEQDVDMLSEAARAAYEDETSLILPPVVAAIDHVFALHEIELTGKRVAVVGYGRLVGKPVATWLERARADVTILTQADPLEDTLRTADVVISGVGVGNLIQPDMIKEGVVLVDVGTSNEGGELRGDIDLRCAPKASLFSSVPGGIGPVTMAMLFKNLLELAKQHQLHNSIESLY